MRETLTILVIVGTRTDEYSLRSQVGIGSESHCLFGQLDRILQTSGSEAGVKTEKVRQERWWEAVKRICDVGVY